MQKYNKFMEFFWLIIAIATTFYGFYIFKAGRAEESVLPFILPFVALAMYGLRRFHRKKMENLNNDK